MTKLHVSIIGILVSAGGNPIWTRNYHWMVHAFKNKNRGVNCATATKLFFFLNWMNPKIHSETGLTIGKTWSTSKI